MSLYCALADLRDLKVSAAIQIAVATLVDSAARSFADIQFAAVHKTP